MNFQFGVRPAGKRPVHVAVPEPLLWCLLLLLVVPATEVLTLRALFRPGRASWRDATVPLRLLGIVRDARGLLIDIVDKGSAFRIAVSDGEASHE